MLEDRLILKDGLIKYLEDGQEIDVTEYISQLVKKKERQKNRAYFNRKEKMFFIPITNERYELLTSRRKLREFIDTVTELMKDSDKYEAGMIERRLFEEFSQSLGAVQLLNGEYNFLESVVLNQEQESILTERLDRGIVEHIKSGNPFIRVVWR